MAEFIKVDALGDACPLPVVNAKKAISELQGAGQVEVLVDNEIAVQNLTKMAQQKGYQYSAEKLEERKYRVLFTLGEVVSAPAEDAPVCTSDARTDTVVAISAAVMGEGSEELGKLMHEGLCAALCPGNRRVASPVSDSIYLMRGAKCTAVLVECGFLSNADEAKLLQMSEYQTKISVVLLSSYLQFMASPQG